MMLANQFAFDTKETPGDRDTYVLKFVKSHNFLELLELLTIVKSLKYMLFCMWAKFLFTNTFLDPTFRMVAVFLMIHKTCDFSFLPTF